MVTCNASSRAAPDDDSKSSDPSGSEGLSEAATVEHDCIYGNEHSGRCWGRRSRTRDTSLAAPNEAHGSSMWAERERMWPQNLVTWILENHNRLH